MSCLVVSFNLAACFTLYRLVKPLVSEADDVDLGIADLELFPVGWPEQVWWEEFSFLAPAHFCWPCLNATKRGATAQPFIWG